MKYTKYIGVFLLLLMGLGLSTAAAAPGVAAGETYTWDLTMSSSVDGTSTTITGTITAEIKSVDGNVITYALSANVQDDSGMFSSYLPSTGEATQDVSAASGMGELFIDADAATKSFSTSMEMTGMTVSYTVVYNDKGVLETYESTTNMLGTEITMSLKLQSGGGGIPGYPMLVLAAATLLGVVLVAMKKRR